MSNMVVTVQKENLLTKLKENREKHQAEFDEAMTGWQAKVHAELEELAELAEEEKLDSIMARSAVDILTDSPVSHIEDYDTAIEMLEWHTGDEMKIQREQFKMYILDQWRWKDSFTLNSARYK